MANKLSTYLIYILLTFKKDKTYDTDGNTCILSRP